MKYYLLVIWGCIDPAVKGPFESEETRDKAAVDFYIENGDEHGLFRMDTLEDGSVDVWPFSGSFFEDAVCAREEA